jgi:hypothetical protein
LAGGFTAFAAGSLKATFGLGVMLEVAGLLLLMAAILLVATCYYLETRFHVTIFMGLLI